MNLIKRLWFKLFSRKTSLSFPMCKGLHRQQLLQALMLISEAESKGACLGEQKKELINMIKKEFNINDRG